MQMMMERLRWLKAQIPSARRAAAGLIVCAQASAATALEPGRDYGCTEPIRVGVYEFGAWYAQGKGVTVDLFDVISAYTGCAFELIEMPRSDVWFAMGKGDIDIVPGSIWTEERAKLARFVTYVNVRNIAIIRDDGRDMPQSLDAFIAGRSGVIGLIDGFLYGSYFDFRLQSTRGDDRIVAVTNPAILFDLLRSGAVELVLAPSIHYFYYVPEIERQASFEILDTSNAEAQQSGFALSRTRFSGPQADNWMRMVEHMLLDGTIREVIGRYLPPRLANSIMTR